MREVASKDDRPSQVSNEFWIHAECPGTPPLDEESAEAYGKWQVYVPRAHVDQAWDTIAHLVRIGNLGPSAKVSTARPNPNSSGSPDSHVIIIYAPDWRDVAEVRRILKSLRDAGLAQGWVHFKRDRETHAGAYVVRGRKGVSVWNAHPGVSDEISTKWVTGQPLLVTDANASEIVDAIEKMDEGQP